VALVATAVSLVFVSGCGSPSQANTQLRKQNQQLQSQLDQLHHQHDADEASIRAMQARATTVPILPEDQLDQLFTATGLKFGRLTGGYRPDANLPADSMLKVYVVPIDQNGDELKSAGSFHIELFDLAISDHNRIGSWDFDLPAAKAAWHGSALMYDYVLDCPWQTPPKHTSLVCVVTFTDALTHRVFTDKRDVTVKLAQ